MGIGGILGAIGGVAGPALAGYGEWKPEHDRRQIEGAQEKDRQQGLLDAKIQKQKDQQFAAGVLQVVTQSGNDPDKMEQGIMQILQTSGQGASPERLQAAYEILEQARTRKTNQSNIEWERNNTTAAQRLPYEQQTATSAAGNANARYMHDTPSPEHIEQYKSRGMVWDRQKGEFAPNPTFKKVTYDEYQKMRKNSLQEWKELYVNKDLNGKLVRDPGSPDFDTYFSTEMAKKKVNVHEFGEEPTGDGIPAGDTTPFPPWKSEQYPDAYKAGGANVVGSEAPAPAPTPAPVPITGAPAPAQTGVPIPAAGGNAIDTAPIYRGNRPQGPAMPQQAPAPAQAAPAPVAPASPQMAPAQQDTAAALQPLLPLIKQLQAQNPQKPLAQIIAELGLPPEMLPIIQQSLGQ